MSSALHPQQRQSDTVKIVVVGETGVGKTAIIQRFTDGNFTEDFKATVGADFSSHWIDVPDGPPSMSRASLSRASLSEQPSSSGRDSMAPLAAAGKTKRVQLHVWDTAGQERYLSLSLAYFKGCEAVMVVFDVCCLDSFHRLSFWLDEVLRGIGRTTLDGFPVFVVGNKIDRPEGQHRVSFDEAAAVMRQRGFPFMTCSAKSGEHIDSIFRALASQALDERDGGDHRVEPALSVKLSSSAVRNVPPPRPTDGDCC